MERRYEPVQGARFVIEQTPSGEQIRTKPPRNLFALIFLPVWLTGWTIGGVVALWSLFTHFQAFTAIWLVFWVGFWVAAAGTWIWMAAGSETLRVQGADLEVAHHVLGYSRGWLYQGSQISDLSITNQMPLPYGFRWQVPFFRVSRLGSIKFNYGPRTIYAAAGLDEGEARMIVDRLAKALRLR